MLFYYYLHILFEYHKSLSDAADTLLDLLPSVTPQTKLMIRVAAEAHIYEPRFKYDNLRQATCDSSKNRRRRPGDHMLNYRDTSLMYFMYENGYSKEDLNGLNASNASLEWLI